MTDAEDAAESFEDYYEDVDDGCGCTEVWEFLSDKRENN
jgi:hypothetical protein